MNYFTATVPLALAEKLKEKGMEMETLDEEGNLWIEPNYAEVFDWLMDEKDCYITIEAIKYGCAKELHYSLKVYYRKLGLTIHNGSSVWYEAAEKAIEKALTLI